MTPLKWDEELINKTAELIYRDAAKHSLLTLATPPEEVLSFLVSAEPYGWALGHGGVCFFSPIIPGLNGTAHTYIWDPLFLRRPALMRALLRASFKKWGLKRATAMIPSRNRMAIRNAKRIGFVQEGEMPRSVLYNEGEDSTVILGILAEHLWDSIQSV